MISSLETFIPDTVGQKIFTVKNICSVQVQCIREMIRELNFHIRAMYIAIINFCKYHFRGMTLAMNTTNI